MIQNIVQRNRVEVKYLVLALAFLVRLAILSSQHVLDAYQNQLDSLMHQLVRWGLLGIFAGALLANSSVIICVPYTLIVITVALVWGNVLILSLVSGLGAGLGQLFSYSVMLQLANKLKALPDSAVYRWICRTLSSHPRKAPMLVFAGLLSFLPDEVVVTPMALAKYPLRKMVIPVIAGKILHTLAVIAIFLPMSNQYSNGSSRTGVTIAIVMICILALLYEIEKATAAKSQNVYAING